MAIGVEWQPRPNQLLTLRGTELRYTFGANPTFGPLSAPIRRSLSFLLNVEPQQNYRLSSRNSIAGGVLRDFNLRLGAEVMEMFAEQGTASFFLGSIIYRRLQFDNENGDQVTAQTVRPALSVGGTISYQF
ncbi:MAG: hypothetical protein OHK0029_39130 [Armatimonadaceae bacterium]